MISQLTADLEQHALRYRQRSTIVERMLSLLEGGPRVFLRSSLPAHMTGSAWIVDRGTGAVVLVHHRKLGIWVQPGGHADGELDLSSVARREAQEETGIEGLDECRAELIDVDIHPIPAIGEIPAHEHYDVRYLFTVGDRGTLSANSEVHAARWVTQGELGHFTSEESILRMNEFARLRLA